VVTSEVDESGPHLGLCAWSVPMLTSEYGTCNAANISGAVVAVHVDTRFEKRQTGKTQRTGKGNVVLDLATQS
jgi:hypothetical protein